MEKNQGYFETKLNAVIVDARFNGEKAFNILLQAETEKEKVCFFNALNSLRTGSIGAFEAYLRIHYSADRDDRYTMAAKDFLARISTRV